MSLLSTLKTASMAVDVLSKTGKILPKIKLKKKDSLLEKVKIILKWQRSHPDRTAIIKTGPNDIHQIWIQDKDFDRGMLVDDVNNLPTKDDIIKRTPHQTSTIN